MSKLPFRQRRQTTNQRLLRQKPWPRSQQSATGPACLYALPKADSFQRRAMSRSHKAIPLGSRLVRRESESGKEAALDRAYKRGSILDPGVLKTSAALRLGAVGAPDTND